MHAGVVQRLQRAFVAGWLVQHQVGFFAVFPRFALDGKAQIVGAEIREWVVARFAVDGHFMMANQDAAQFARAKALRVENTFNLHEGNL